MHHGVNTAAFVGTDVCVHWPCRVCAQVLDGLLLRALPALLFAIPFYFLMGLNAAALQVRVGGGGRGGCSVQRQAVFLLGRSPRVHDM